MNHSYRKFYVTRASGRYLSDAPETNISTHYYSRELKQFISEYNLVNKRCLEVGAGRGIFQDEVCDYTGLDVAESLRKYHRKSYVLATERGYPLDDNSFDAVWSFFCHEHIPNLQQSLLELKRVLRPGGYCLFAPAWQCASWLSKGYCYRPYSDLSLKGKVVKASIPFRSSLIYRSAKVFPKRAFRHALHLMGFTHEQMRFKKLNANYEVFWGPDSDACNSLEPHDAILWFVSNGFTCLSHPTHAQKFLVRTGALIFQKND